MIKIDSDPVGWRMVCKKRDTKRAFPGNRVFTFFMGDDMLNIFRG